MPLPEKPVKILRASAGSGKTFTLTSYYLELLFSDPNPWKYREILAVTFTNKATEEMKSRILQDLRRLAENDEKSPYRNLLIEKYGFNPVTLASKARDIYRRILHDYGRFSVMTIDSFVQKVIRSFASEFGLEPGFKVEINTKKVKNTLVYALSQELNTNPVLLDFCINLVKDRLRNNKPWNYQSDLLELADNIFKDEFLIFEKSLEEILKTQTKEEVFNIIRTLVQERIRNFQQGMYEKLGNLRNWIKTHPLNPEDFHSKTKSPFFNLEKYFSDPSKEIPLDKLLPLFKKLDSPDEWFQKKLDKPDIFQAVNPLIREIYNFYQDGMAKFETAKALHSKLPFYQLLLDLTRLLKSYREESGDLLISDAQRLLEGITHPDSGNPSFIWEKIGNRYRNFLLDEFQDTSQMQWNNFRPLLEESISTHSGSRVENLIVGDVKQSIYRWRNGDYELLYKKVIQDLGPEYVSESSLGENYRSRGNIIHFNNELFKRLPELIQNQLNHKVREIEDKDFESWWYEKGYASVIPDIYKEAHQDTHSRTLGGGKIKVAILKNTNGFEEGEDSKNEDNKSKIIKTSIFEIQKLLEQGFNYSDFCVLVRTNNEVNLVLQAFLEFGIPVVSGDALKLGNQKSIEILIYALRYLLGPSENSPFFLACLLVLYADWKGDPFPYDALKKNIESDAILPVDFLSRLVELKNLPITELYERLVKIFQLDTKENDIPYLLGFRDLLAAFNENGEEGLSRFLAWWDEEGKGRGLSSGNVPNAVQISTVHKSKGLAYRSVFLPLANWEMRGFNKKEFWISTELTEYSVLGKVPIDFTDKLAKSEVGKEYFKELLDSYLDSINELYVALTRARDYIFISLPAKKERKNIDIGDFIYLAINQMNLTQEVIQENQYFSLGDLEFLKTAIPISSPAEHSLILQNYPYSNRLATRKNQLDTGNRYKADEATEWGTLLHEVLSRVEHIDELDPILLELRNKGRFLRSDMEGLREEIIAILSHEELKGLYKGQIGLFNERTLLVKGESVYRPDKVILKKDETIILDYKFTKAVRREHSMQVKKYSDLLTQMHYPNIKAYLYYHFNQSLLKV